MLVWSWAIVLVAAVSPQATVRFVDGRTEQGQLVEVSGERVVMETRTAGRQTWDARTLRDIQWGTPPGQKPGQRRVVLRDGSRLLIEDFRYDGSKAVVTRPHGQHIELAPSAVDHVLLQDLSNHESLLEQWQQLVGQPRTGDAIVYRVDRDGTTRLDILEGVLRGVGDVDVAFEVEGDVLRPKRERVVGILFFTAAMSPLPSANVRILEKDGSLWNVLRLAEDDQGLVWTTAGGVDQRADWDALAVLDYTAGNWLYLSDMTPESVVWRPFIESRVSRALLERLYQPRFDEAFDGGPIRLGGRPSSKGLALRSYNEVTFRVPTGYRRLRATAGLDDRVHGTSAHAIVRVVLDDRVVWEQPLADGSSPIEIDLPVENARRLRIIVDFGDRGDIADYVHLADARLTK